MRGVFRFACEQAEAGAARVGLDGRELLATELAVAGVECELGEREADAQLWLEIATLPRVAQSGLKNPAGIFALAQQRARAP
jgi:hypothetical protein